MTDPRIHPTPTHPTPTHPSNGSDTMFIVIHQDAADHPSTVWSQVHADGTMDLWDGGTHLLEKCSPLEIHHFLNHGYSECLDGDQCPLLRSAPVTQMEHRITVNPDGTLHLWVVNPVDQDTLLEYATPHEVWDFLYNFARNE